MFKKANKPNKPNLNPNLSLGFYPEKLIPQKHFFNRCHHQYVQLKFLFRFIFFKVILFNLINVNGKNARPYQRFVTKVNQAEESLVSLSNQALTEHINTLKTRLSLSGLNDALTIAVFAAVKQTATRVLGVTPYNTQLMAAKMMLDGKLAEMATGEGKTLTAGICVASAALAGIPVHVVTANDYLVVRDAQTLAPLYQALGLSVGTVTKEIDFAQRQLAYARNITYCTAKEVVFDYLRDKTQLEHCRTDRHLRAAQLAGQKPQLLLRGLYMAIIDEADSILIDEARVPLILSQSNLNAVKISYFEQALKLAKNLVFGVDYTLNHDAMMANLTIAGAKRLQNDTLQLGAIWKNKLFFNETISHALSSLHLFKRDKHYIVAPDETGKQSVQIVDEITGRVSPGRVWSKGLHQLIELEEACPLSGEMVTMTQITYQRFFPKYLQLGGMSGTLNGLDKELYNTFGLISNVVPLRQKSKLKQHPTRLYPCINTQFNAAISIIKAVHAIGRPILIGTDSVADSEKLSALLTQAGLKHNVLNARQNAAEAAIVASAGQLGCITVSTNMAGRGTDIALSIEAKRLGGLHVISCQHNVAKRIDRQLIGRAARQGDPGSAQMLLTIEKLPLYIAFPQWLKQLTPTNGLSFPAWFVYLIVRLPQWVDEYNQYEQRRELLQNDQSFDEESQLLN